MNDRYPSEADRGAAVIGTTAGFVVFLLLLFVAVQILFNLYATSMVTSAAHEAARSVAGFGSPADRCAAVAAADARFEEALGDYGDAGQVTLVWNCVDPDVITLRVIADHPTVLPPRLAGLLDLGRLDRTIAIRVETFR